MKPNHLGLRDDTALGTTLLPRLNWHLATSPFQSTRSFEHPFVGIIQGCQNRSEPNQNAQEHASSPHFSDAKMKSPRTANVVTRRCRAPTHGNETDSIATTSAAGHASAAGTSVPPSFAGEGSIKVRPNIVRSGDWVWGQR